MRRSGRRSSSGIIRQGLPGPPDGGGAPTPTPGLGYLAMLALALFALMLPIAGPLDDHHFAERMPAHGHIYPDGRPVPHQHFYQGAQWHSHPTASGTDGNRPSSDMGAVATLGSAAASLLPAAWSTPYHPAPDGLRAPAPKRKDGSRLARFAAPFRRGNGISIRPPHPPPVA